MSHAKIGVAGTVSALVLVAGMGAASALGARETVEPEASRSSNGPAFMGRETMAEFERGMSLLERDPGGAVAIFKRIATDKGYAPYERAGAILFALRPYYGTFDRGRARALIFSGDPQWSALLEGTDLDGAVRRAWEWANRLTPTAEALYHLAVWYAHELWEHQVNPAVPLSPEDQARYADLTAQHARSAESLFVEAIQGGAFSRPEVRIGGAFQQAFLYELRGLLQEIYFYLNQDQEGFKRSAHESYQGAMRILEAEPLASVEGSQNIAFYVRYHYASFLAMLTEQGIEDRREEVHALLTPVIDASNRELPFYTFLLNQAKEPVSVSLEQRFQALMRVDPRVRTLLGTLGWEG